MVVVFDSDVLIPLILPASRSTRLLDRLGAAGHLLRLREWNGIKIVNRAEFNAELDRLEAEPAR